MAKNLVFLFFLTLLFRLPLLQVPDLGGDAMNIWWAAKSVLFSGELPSTHHHFLRWGLHWPNMVSLLVFGETVWAYYFVPLFFTFIQLVVSDLILKSYSKHFLPRLLLIVLWLSFPQLRLDSSQVLDGIYSSTYLLLAFYFSLNFIKSHKKRHFLWLLAFLMLSYLAKLSNLSVMAGWGFWLLLSLKKNIRISSVLTLTLGLCAFVVFETLWWRSYYGLEFGQLSSLQQNYGQTGRLKALSFFDYLFRWKDLGDPWIFLLFTTLALAVSVFFVSIRKRLQDPLFLGLVCVSSSFLFIIAYAIKSVQPLMPALLLQDRYLSPILPFVCLLLIVSILKIFKIKRLSLKKQKRIFVSLIVMLVLGWAHQCYQFGPRTWNRWPPLLVSNFVKDFKESWGEGEKFYIEHQYHRPELHNYSVRFIYYFVLPYAEVSKIFEGYPQKRIEFSQKCPPPKIANKNYYYLPSQTIGCPLLVEGQEINILELPQLKLSWSTQKWQSAD